MIAQHLIEDAIETVRHSGALSAERKGALIGKLTMLRNACADNAPKCVDCSRCEECNRVIRELFGGHAPEAQGHPPEARSHSPDARQ